jgi:hypothetical protein
MQHSSLNYDKVMKPITRAVEALKREKELKRELSGVIKEVNNLESAADKVAEFKSVVDEKSYDDKVKLLNSLQKACGDAINEVKCLSKSLDKSKDKPKDKSKDVVNYKPALEELTDGLVKVQEQTKKNLGDLTSWFSKASKPGECEIKVPRDVTDMIEMADARGRIGMPSDQSFDATISLSYAKSPTLGDMLEKNSREVIGEIGRALKPLKQEVAKAFKVWNSEFAEIEKQFDRPAAEKLFKTMNDWFSGKLPTLVEPALKEAVKQAVKDVCTQDRLLKDAWSEVKINVACDYGNIAEFVLKFPDNPAEDAAKSLGKQFDSMESAHKGYTDAIKLIMTHYESIRSSSDTIRKLLADLQTALKRGGNAQAIFDKDKRLREQESKNLGSAITGLETALKDGEHGRSELAKHLEPVKKKVEDPKAGLKDNATIKPAELDKLRKLLTATMEQLNGSVKKKLDEQHAIVDAAKNIQTGFGELGSRDKSPPSADDVQKLITDVKKASDSFSAKPSDLHKELTVNAELSKLRSLSENLKS